MSSIDVGLSNVRAYSMLSKKSVASDAISAPASLRSGDCISAMERSGGK